ncbi:MAG: isoprenylcysteine carboxylmethyltransferase family protein [Proteobacteria bacterium]|nr:isoprenylcysteine carboxylmethyltransferase family protein [Pseudomonadota bacterium]
MIKLGEVLFKFRDYTPIPFAIIMMVFAAADRNSLIIGTAIMVLGELIRIYGVSHIGGVSRTRTFSTGQKLITSGPFSHVRNPLYIGNLFLTGGLVVASNISIYFTLIFVACFFFQYIPVVKWEESNLRTVFGDEFDEYSQKVPPWLPVITSRIKNQEKVKKEYKTAIVSEKNTIAAALIVYLVILWQSDWFEMAYQYMKSM